MPPTPPTPPIPHHHQQPPSQPSPPTSSSTPNPKPKETPTFTSLPTELHLLVASHLTYPDALSLKHVNRHFYHIVDTGVSLKVAWLVERRLLHLEWPNDRRCDLGSDLKFCRGSVRLLMRRRRDHFECESRPGLGCVVLGRTTCEHRRRRRAQEEEERAMRRRRRLRPWGLLCSLFFSPFFLAPSSSSLFALPPPAFGDSRDLVPALCRGASSALRLWHVLLVALIVPLVLACALCGVIAL
ncbi:hypothetical protein ACRALDRAFT_1067082 [Sodiomyces alcalophilus JCM 7366]|uniref:uncharacterized protein n=1 Tax=Sodiomyces alcalophilus JCM 7366 TaxID=591952 RepID=UPI0039B65AE1